jgi:hypothetical protein
MEYNDIRKFILQTATDSALLIAGEIALNLLRLCATISLFNPLHLDERQIRFCYSVMAIDLS